MTERAESFKKSPVEILARLISAERREQASIDLDQLQEPASKGAEVLPVIQEEIARRKLELLSGEVEAAYQMAELLDKLPDGQQQDIANYYASTDEPVDHQDLLAELNRITNEELKDKEK